MNLRRSIEMGSREIPKAEMDALALINMQAAIVSAAFRLFCNTATAVRLSRSQTERPQTANDQVQSIRDDVNLDLQRIVAAKALASEACGAINLARRMAAQFPDLSDSISELQIELGAEFPELTAVRNSFAHLDERAETQRTTSSEDTSDGRLWGLNGNVLSVRGLKGQLVEVTLSEKLPLAIYRLLDGIIEMFPKKAGHSDMMKDLMASPVGPWLRDDF